MGLLSIFTSFELPLAIIINNCGFHTLHWVPDNSDCDVWLAGIGTIITAFFMGPLIEFFNVHVARPILAKE